MQSASTMMPLRVFRVVFDLLDDRMRFRRRRLNHDLVTNSVNGHATFLPLSRQVSVLAAGSQLSFSDFYHFTQTCPWPTYTAVCRTTPPHRYSVYRSYSKC